MKGVFIALLLVQAGCTSPETRESSTIGITTNRFYGDMRFGPDDDPSTDTCFGEEIWDGDRMVERRVMDDGIMVLQTTYTNERLGKVDAVTLCRDADGSMTTLSVERVKSASLTKAGREKELNRRANKLSRELGLKWE